MSARVLKAAKMKNHPGLMTENCIVLIGPARNVPEVGRVIRVIRIIEGLLKGYQGYIRVLTY